MFTLIDTKYLKSLGSDLETRAWKGVQKIMAANGHVAGLKRPYTQQQALDTPSRRLYFMSCPYCQRTTFWTSTKLPKKAMVPRFCPFCGEMDPWDRRLEGGLKTATLIHLADDLEQAAVQQDPGSLNSQRARVLREQAVVTTATEIEVFMRDAYAISMNAKYVKEGETLYPRFHKDGSNRFSNIEKSVKALGDDLGIDLRSLTDKDDLELLDLLSAKRNAIVHNSGVADRRFMTRCGQLAEVLNDLKQAPRQGRPIPITSTELSRATAAADDVTQAMRGELEKALEPRTLERFLKAL